MDEINVVCAPMMVYLEDVSENPVSAQRKKRNLQEESLKPVFGSISELSDQISSLPLSLNMGYDGLVSNNKRSKRRSTVKQAGQVSMLQDRQGSPPPPPPGQSRSGTVSEKREGGMPKLVELYQFPGFSPDAAMPLPHNTPFATVVAHVVRAQHKLNHKPRYKATFQGMLSSVLVEQFVTDVFWWLFLKNFQPDGHVQDCLFSRIADNYIRILTHNQSSRTGDVFLREFPSILSQTLYSCFCCCFPQSCSTIRNGSFLQTLCYTAYQWTGGVCPAPNVYKKWDFEALEPDEASTSEFTTENEKKETESTLSLLDCSIPAQHDTHLSTLTARRPTNASLERTLSNSKEQSIDGASERKEKSAGPEDIKGSDQKAATDHSSGKPAKESQSGWYELEFRHCVFNMWGNSPLVQHYMQKLQLEPKVGQDIIVRRTQIDHLPPANAVTYRQLVHQCRERSAVHWREVKASMARCEQDLAALQRSKAEFRRIILNKQKRILSEPCSIKQFCQKLYPDTTTEEETERHSENS